jgi:hypothetical protein
MEVQQYTPIGACRFFIVFLHFHTVEEIVQAPQPPHLIRKEESDDGILLAEEYNVPPQIYLNLQTPMAGSNFDFSFARFCIQSEA